MKFWTMALAALAIGWCAPAQAAISPGCATLADSAHRAGLEARGGFVSQFESRAAAVTEQDRIQRLADAADAVLLAGAVRSACAGAGDAAPRDAIAKDVVEHQATVTAALAANNCLPVLSAVQNRLLELARGMESGSSDPMMPAVLEGTLMVGAQVRDRCTGDARTAAIDLAEQGASLQKLFATMAACQPMQQRYQQSLMKAATMVADAAQADYDKFLREDYEPALAGVKAGCGEILNPEMIAANDAKIRDFAKLKDDAQKARQPAAATPNAAVAP